MKVDVTLGGLGLEVWSFCTQSKPRLFFGSMGCKRSTGDYGNGLSIGMLNGGEGLERARSCAGEQRYHCSKIVLNADMSTSSKKDR